MSAPTIAIQRMMTCASRVPARLGLPDRAAPASPKCVSRRARLRTSAVLLGAAFSLGIAAGAWTNLEIRAGIHLQETLTSNVNLSDPWRSPTSSPRSLRHCRSRKKARAPVSMAPSPSRGCLYARTGAENNQLYPLANLLGNAELVDRFFFVEARRNRLAAVLQPVWRPTDRHRERHE